MSKYEIYQFYVEGEDEKKVIETLKKDMNCIVSGKVDVLNVVFKEINLTRIRALKSGTNVVLVYDTDIEKTDILDKNIKTLASTKHIKRIICIPQVENLEDELIRATNIHQVTEILGSKTLTDYKRDLIKCSNLDKKLKECGFEPSRFWNEIPTNAFNKWGNDSSYIRKKTK